MTGDDNTKDDSTFGGDTVPGSQNPKEPTQAELDADRASNPDTSKQVSDTDSGGGG